MLRVDFHVPSRFNPCCIANVFITSFSLFNNKKRRELELRAGSKGPAMHRENKKCSSLLHSLVVGSRFYSLHTGNERVYTVVEISFFYFILLY